MLKTTTPLQGPLDEPTAPATLPPMCAAPTFLLVPSLTFCRPAAPRQAEGALSGKAGATGVEGSRHSTLFLPPLLPFQAGSERTAHSVAQPLALQERWPG